MDDIRLTEVEVRYTYLERLVEDLSKVLHDQQRLIDSLSTRVDRIESLIADAMNQSSEQPPHEKPPHY
ncbi:MAG TPA: SlyX family protein [Polyangiaceae bacterium]|nr:SlyX family protein [Polyangiaceae bacterium]